MKQIKDYKNTRTAIYCKSEGEWNKISQMMKYKWKNSNFNSCEDICINMSDKTRSPKSYYKANNYEIIPASEFLIPEIINDYSIY